METNDIGENNLQIQDPQPDDDYYSETKLSDVIEVIGEDMYQNNPLVIGGIANSIEGGIIDPEQQQQQTTAYNGSHAIPQQSQPQPQQPQQQALQQPQIPEQVQQPQTQPAPQNSRGRRGNAFVKVIEQPATKALRFRYECEGRSAGSIPGVNYTSENKTYPTIEVAGYRGRAVVVVSCVTKDPPYKPHPHNLVGKEGCKRGVCTLEINSETMRAVFNHLGIQCVKKKDIESALRVREEIRVDPFKTGFAHRYQPSSIDLNSVRLCFQVFLESEQRGRFTVPLAPVVSDPIYDKKAMSDLVICGLCSCSSTVAGGKDIILLCEKVAKEDISVRFFEEQNGRVIWEGFGDFAHTDVHKQTAIKFKTPRYRSLDVDQPVKVFIQLRRPSDGATSEALQFDYLPLDSGRRTFWALRRNLKRKPDIDIFQRILSEDSEATKLSTPTELSNGLYEQQQSEIIVLDTPTSDEEKLVTEEEAAKRQCENEVDNIIDEKVRELEMTVPIPELYLNANTQTSDSLPQISEQMNEDDCQMATIENSDLRQLTANDKITEWMKSNEFERADSLTPLTPPTGSTILTSDEDKTLNDLLDQVAELDEIYVDHKLRRDTFQNTISNELSGIDNCVSKSNPNESMEIDDIFDDAATYTSLQIAFKNPLPMTDIMPPTPPASQLAPEDMHYDPVEIIINPPGPVIDVTAPPLRPPPMPVPAPAPQLKRDNKIDEEKLPPLPPKRIKKHENNENRSIASNTNTLTRPQSQIIIMKSPDHMPPNKRLPPTPNQNNTLPKQKKPGFFSKLFSRKKSKSDLTNENSSRNQSKATSPADSREPSIGHFSLADPNRSSLRSIKSLQPTSVSTPPGAGDGGNSPKKAKPVGRSVSSVSGKRPHLTVDVVHIPLKGDSLNSLPIIEGYSNASTITLNNNLDRKTVSALQLADIPINDGNMELIAIADAQSLKNLCEGEYGVQLDPSVDLTEAEHFALYTSIPPQATTSEFDETSCYYAPVDAGEILTPTEVAKRLAGLNK